MIAAPRKTLLLVDDNPGDIDLIREALDEFPVPVEIMVASDGPSALAYLRPAEPTSARPHLIVMDLNMPMIDGRDVLASIKSDALLRAIPVVIFTSSSAPRDMLEAYRLGANCYVTKPIELPEYYATVRSIARFWLVVATGAAA